MEINQKVLDIIYKFSNIFKSPAHSSAKKHENQTAVISQGLICSLTPLGSLPANFREQGTYLSAISLLIEYQKVMASVNPIEACMPEAVGTQFTDGNKSMPKEYSLLMS